MLWILGCLVSMMLTSLVFRVARMERINLDNQPLPADKTKWKAIKDGAGARLNALNFTKIVAIFVEALTFSVCALALSRSGQWGFLGILAFLALWELMSYVLTDVAHLNLRIGLGGRVAGANAMCKEGLERKWPWEKARTYSQLVGNYQGFVRAACGMHLHGSTAPSERGLIQVDFTVQDRISSTATDRRGRIRAPEMSTEVIKEGIRDRVEALLVGVTAYHSFNKCLGSKEAFEVMGRCSLELATMPHVDPAFLNSSRTPAVYRAYGAPDKIDAGGVPEEERLQFYEDCKHRIGELLDSPARSTDSWYESTYGRDMVNLSFTTVLPADPKLREALDMGARSRIIEDAIKAHMDRFSPSVSYEDARRAVLAASGLATVNQLDVSGGGSALPIINMGGK